MINVVMFSKMNCDEVSKKQWFDIILIKKYNVQLIKMCEETYRFYNILNNFIQMFYFTC